MLYRSGTTFNLIGNQGQVLKELPFGFYKIVETMKGVHLEKCSDPVTVALVGVAKTASEVMIQLWNSSTDKNPSTMLTGASGNGKTQTAFNVAKVLQLPTILVTGQHPELLMSVLECVGGPVMLLFDEFEKNYSSEDGPDNSNSLLTFLDGIATPVKVFNVMTINERQKLSKFLFNRPGRILFDFKFDPLTVEVAMQFIESRIKVEDTERLIAFLQKVSDLSYDICDKIIYVLGIFPDTYEEVLPHMNIEVGEIRFSVTLVKKGEFDEQLSYDGKNPLSQADIVWYSSPEVRFSEAKQLPISFLLKKESEIEIPLSELNLRSQRTGQPLSEKQKSHKRFEGIVMKVERRFIPKRYQSTYNLDY